MFVEKLWCCVSGRHYNMIWFYQLSFWININISIWATAHLPLPKPNIDPNLISIDCCWVRGGVGGQLPRY